MRRFTHVRNEANDRGGRARGGRLVVSVSVAGDTETLVARAIEAVRGSAPAVPEIPPAPVNRTVEFVLRAEHTYARWVPFGTSLMAVATPRTPLSAVRAIPSKSLEADPRVSRGAAGGWPVVPAGAAPEPENRPRRRHRPVSRGGGADARRRALLRDHARRASAAGLSDRQHLQLAPSGNLPPDGEKSRASSTR